MRLRRISDSFLKDTTYVHIILIINQEGKTYKYAGLIQIIVKENEKWIWKYGQSLCVCVCRGQVLKVKEEQK